VVEAVTPAAPEYYLIIGDYFLCIIT